MSITSERPRRAFPRILVAAAFLAGGIAAGGTAASAAVSSENETSNKVCYEQITEYEYRRDTHRTQYRYIKQVRGDVERWSNRRGWEDFGSFAWVDWSGHNPGRWEDSASYSNSGRHSGIQRQWNSGGRTYREVTTRYRYHKTNETRQVKTGTETTWATSSPGEDWTPTGASRVVQGDQIRCEQPDPVAPFVTEWVDGIWACDDTTVTQTRTIVTYEWVESGKYDWTLVSTANVETRVRDLTVDEQFPCEVPIDEEPETPIEEDPETPIEEEPETPIDEPADEVAPPVEDEEEALAPVTPTLPETPAPAPTPAAPVAAPTVLPSAGSSTGILAALAALLMLTGLGAHRFGRQRIN